MRYQRAATGLSVQFEQLRGCVGVKHIAHSNGPQLPAYPGQRQIFNLERAIEKEGEPRPETVYVEPARAEQFDIGKPI